jgi:hypothetical protein
MSFEDLNIEGTKAFWGRKVSDLRLSSFINILDSVAFKWGKTVARIDRWERTKGKCCQYGVFNPCNSGIVFFIVRSVT